MRLKNLTWILAAALTCCTVSVYGITGSDTSFWNSNQEGWFWYKQDPEPIEPEEIEEPEIQIAESKPEEPKETPKEEPKTEVAEVKGPPIGSVEWIKVNLQTYKRLALDKPTVANLRAYMYMQRLAMDRAEEFAHAGQLAVHGDPFLDETARAPLGGSYAVQRRNYQKEEQRHALEVLFNHIGIFFVFKNNCYMCDLQAEAMQLVKRWYNAPVRAVSIDQPTEISKTAKIFPDYIVNPNILKQLNIYALPSTFIIDENEEIVPLVQGVLTVNDFSDRVIEKAIEKHWLPDQQLAHVRPSMDDTSLSAIFDPDSKYISDLQKVGGEDPYGVNSNFIEPTKLVELIRQAKEKELDSDFIPRGY